MGACSCEQALQEITGREFAPKRDRLLKTVLEWTFETYETAFSLILLPPNISGDPRFIKEKSGMVFLVVILSSTLDPGFRV